ncbi:MAG: hypothetical protein RSE41_08980 [Clostridia bacterium]
MKKSITTNVVKNIKKNNNLFKIILLLIVVVIVVFCVSSIGREKVINSKTDMFKVNTKKYSSVIVFDYNKTGEQLFITEMENVQNVVANYLLENSTTDKNSFKKLVKKVNSEINKNKSKVLNFSKSKYYVGKYNINKDGQVKFKFDKNVDPKWNNKYIIK